MPADNRDSIRINDLLLSVPLFSGAQWARDKPDPVQQPISVSLAIFHDVSGAAHGDDLSQSLNYAVIAKKIRSSIGSSSFQCLQDFSGHVSDALADVLVDALDGLEVHVTVVQLRPPLHTKTIGVEHTATFSADGSWKAYKVKHFLENLVCPAIIGVNQAERDEKQDVTVNLEIETGEEGLAKEDWIDLRAVTKLLYEKICSSDFQTLEALTSFVAFNTLVLLPSYATTPAVSVRIAKPSALVFAGSSEVSLRRTLDDYSKDAAHLSQLEDGFHHVSIALGSNMGDSFYNIEYALRLLEEPSYLLSSQSITDEPDAKSTVRIVDTSFLYETQPMYVTDQSSFINGACMIETNLTPKTLLVLLKKIEAEVGRVPSIRNGPRAVDLDIIFYDDAVIDTRKHKADPDHLDGVLIIPHPRLHEREFVLRPLNDMIPDYVHPILKRSVETLLRQVVKSSDTPMKKVIPFPSLPLPPSSASPYPTIPPIPITLCSWSYRTSDDIFATGKGKTHLMATVNVTPDSFSDGGDHYKLSAALSYISSSVAAGATIVDIGGYSTRPGAAVVSVQDEIDRVVPVIRCLRDEQALRALALKVTVDPEKHIHDLRNVLISVDTFRPEVAKAAILAGANCINDVHAFTGPDSWPDIAANEYTVELKAIAREFSVPIVLMHSRGDAGKNKDYSAYDYAGSWKGRGGATVEGVRVELGKKVDMVVKGKGGVRRWMVVVDPGVGFSKTLEGNLEVLRAANEVVGDVKIGNALRSDKYRNPLRGFPLLIGASKKSFLGAILAKEPDGRETQAKERDFATAAAVSCAVQQNALVVRVHDVQQMMDVVKVAKALYV